MICVGPSRIDRQGLFATQEIKKGTRIIQYMGLKISKAEGARRAAAGNAYIFELNERYDIDGKSLSNIARYINHSCDPNCDAVVDDMRIWIETIRDIEPGEELAYDYAYVLEERHSPAAKRRYPCTCGAAKCRGTILAKKRG